MFFDIRRNGTVVSCTKKVFTREDLSDITKLKDRCFGKSLTETCITEEGVLKKMERVKPDKAAGLDEIHPKLLFEARNQLARPLTKIFL